MLPSAPIAYRYDGTLDGLLCCIFRCFTEKRIPEALIKPDDDQVTLFPVTDIQTDAADAQRVAKGVCAKISEDFLGMLDDATLCGQDGADLAALQAACLGFEVGPGVTDMLAEPCVDLMMKALRHAWGEAHLLTGFVRFREFGGAMIATIAPKNRVLKLLAPHFAQRFAQEMFMIYDEAHHEALIHQRGRTGIYPIQDFQPPPMEDPEREITFLWQRYFKAISIQQRENPTCQRGHMPKRYWKHMVETQDEVWYDGEISNQLQQGGPPHDPALPPQAHARRAEGRAVLQGAQDRGTGRGSDQAQAGRA